MPSGEVKRSERGRPKHELSMDPETWEYLDDLALEHGLDRSNMAEKIIWDAMRRSEKLRAARARR